MEVVEATPCLNRADRTQAGAVSRGTTRPRARRSVMLLARLGSKSRVTSGQSYRLDHDGLTWSTSRQSKYQHQDHLTLRLGDRV